MAHGDKDSKAYNTHCPGHTSRHTSNSSKTCRNKQGWPGNRVVATMNVVSSLIGESHQLVFSRQETGHRLECGRVAAGTRITCRIRVEPRQSRLSRTVCRAATEAPADQVTGYNPMTLARWTYMKASYAARVAVQHCIIRLRLLVDS